jgi:hypothetical protein
LSINELARLERYRRIAKHHGLDLPQGNILPVDEIDYIRSQLNAKFYLDAKPWMLPSWAVLTLKDFDKEQSTVTEFSNTMYSNYSLIGGVGTKKYGTTDSRGLLSALIDCGSLDFWLQDGEQLLFPALIGKDGPQLKLVSSEDQVYEWTTYIRSVEFTRLVYHVVRDGVEYIYNEINLRNHGLEDTKFTFFVLVRPMSVLGVEPIEHIQYEASGQRLYVNRLLALLFDKMPDGVLFGENFDNEFLQAVMSMSGKTNQESPVTSFAGLATISMKFTVSLAPAGSQRLFFWAPLASISPTDEFSQIKPTPDDRDKTIGEWFNFSDSRAKVVFPEERMDTILSQAAVSLAIHAFPVMFPEIPHLAALDWKERMRILLGLIRSGSMTVAEKVVDTLTRTMGVPKGSLDLSTYSPLLWGLHQFLEFTQGKTLDEDFLKFLKRVTAGVVAETKSQIKYKDESDAETLQHRLVIKEGAISDFEQMLWNYIALKSGLTTISPLHESDLIQDLSYVVEHYKAIILDKCSEIEQARWLRPTDPIYEKVEDEILRLLGAAAQFKDNVIEPSFLQFLRSKISHRRIVNGLWKTFQPIEKYSSHLALRLAQFYILTKQRDDVEPLLKRALEFLSDDYQLPESVNPRTYGGSGSIGLSVEASADLILLMSDMIVSEAGSTLIVLPGVPEEWFTAKRPLFADRLPLMSGLAHIEIGMSANQFQIEVGMEDFPEEIEIYVPPSVPMSMVKVYGGSIVERAFKASSPFLRVIPLSDVIVLTYHR